MNNQLQPTYVLHGRPYRNTSMLIDLLTQTNGKVTVVARGVRQARSRNKGILQPFTPLLMNWTGKGELKTLQNVEAQRTPYPLLGNRMISGFYLNELLMRLLKPFDPYPNLFTVYETTLQQLSQATDYQPSLRQFEKQLLSELGYALPLTCDAKTGMAISTENYYNYQPDQGFTQAAGANINTAFLGKIMLAIDKNQFEDKEVMRQAKRLIRMALAPLLGNKPLKTRELILRRPQ